MSIRNSSAVAGILLVAVFAFAGCGGGDDGSSASVSSADQAKLQGVADSVESAVKDGSAAQYCALMQPSRIDAVFGSKAACIKGMTPVVKQSGFANLTLTSVNGDDTHATVLFKELPGRPIKFIKEDGQWYFDLSDAKPAAKSGSGTPEVQKAPDPQGATAEKK